MNRIYWLPNQPKGRLGMMARPRGNDWLVDEIQHLKMNEVRIVVSLLEKDETYELGLQHEAALCSQLAIEFISFPIPDRSIPEDKKGFINLAWQLLEKLDEGQSIVVHCRMGIGRTALLCAAILVLQGASPATVFEHLSAVRTLEVPDTSEQKKWLQAIEF